MDKELRPIRKDDTWKLKSLPKGKREKGNWSKMSVQSKKECKKESREVQNKIDS